MQSKRYALLLIAIFAVVSADAEPDSRITIRAKQILDGKGEILPGNVIVIEGSIIVGIEQGAHETTYDLGTATILPGLIDTHVHISWHFDENGKSHDPETGAEAEHSLEYGSKNAKKTLLGGVTTVQSLGSPVDQLLQKRIQKGEIPGSRILTSLEPITQETGGEEQIRSHVDSVHARGGNVIKIFASQSIRDGGGPTLTLEQLRAACGRAKELGLRSTVHAHGPESVRRAVEAGCTSIEHGVLLQRQSLELMAAHGTYFDPHLSLLFRNYFENKEHFLGIGNYTEEGFARMQEAVPIALKMFQEALKVKNLKIVFGTDAVAGAHGRNVEELIYRSQKGGQTPADAIVSATSLAAESLGLQNEIGTLASGMTADLIAVQGDPLKDMGALRHIIFVMKNGIVLHQQDPERSSGKDSAPGDTGPLCALDMGSNTFKFIVAEVKAGEYLQHIDIRKTVGVGDDISASLKNTGRKNISDAKLQQIGSVISGFQNECKQRTGSRKIRAIATAAFREAENKNVLTEQLAQKEVFVQILTEEQEAEFAYETTTLGEPDYAVVDLGSRTTEFVTKKDNSYLSTLFQTGYKTAWDSFYNTTETFGSASAEHLRHVSKLVHENEMQILRNRKELRVVEAGEVASFILGIPQTEIEGKVIRRDEIKKNLQTLSKMNSKSFEDFKKKTADVEKIIPRLVMIDFILDNAGYDLFRVTNRELNVALIYRLAREL